MQSEAAEVKLFSVVKEGSLHCVEGFCSLKVSKEAAELVSNQLNQLWSKQESADLQRHDQINTSN